MELSVESWKLEETAAAWPVTGSRSGLWAGRIVSGVVILFLVVDGVGKVLRLAPVMTATTQLGYPASAIFGTGLALLCCVVAYAVPRTAVLGAVLLTGYLGGAVAVQVRIGNPLLTHTLLPVYAAVLVWGGLYLRDVRLRALLPLRAPGEARRRSR